MSNLIEEFDANYGGGIGLYDSIVDLIETSKVDTPEARRVSDESVFTVAERALTASALLPMDVQHFNTIREVTNFLTLASNGAISDTVSKHTDLLPVSHPASTCSHEFSASELRQARAEWISADPRIEDESVRAIVAAVYASNPNSLDFHYNLIRLNSLSDQVPSDLRITPLVAFGDPYAGKNSFWHRKMRAEAQRRDDEGQFAEMGGGARIYVRMPMGNIISVVGKVAGIPENDPNGIDLEITDVPGITPGIYTVPADMSKFFKAILPEDAISKSSPVGPGLNVKYIDIADMVRKDLPTSWFESETGSPVPSLSNAVRATKNYATGDGYRVAMYDGPSEKLQQRVDEARDKFGSLVVNTRGTDVLENDKPVYELISTKRGQEEVVGYSQDWSTVQAMAKNEDENYPDAENEPIVETKEPVAQLPEEPQPVAEPTPIEDDPLDEVETPAFDPYESLPNDWMLTGQNNTFVSRDGTYSAVYSDAVVGSQPEEDFNLDTGLKSYRETPVSLPGVMNIYDELNGNFIGSAFNWDDAQRYIQSYEQDEDGVLVDRMEFQVDRQKQPVQVDQLDPQRYELLEAKDADVKAAVEKDKASNRYKDIWNKLVGVAGIDEGVLDPSLKQPLLYPINNLLQSRDVDAKAVDMVDELLDYPQNYTTAQMVTLYHNLKKYPAYTGQYDRKNAFGFPQDRQKMRVTLADLEKYELNNDPFVKDKKDLIDNYRFIGHKALQQLRRELNTYINDNSVREGNIAGEAVVFKDKTKITGKDLIKSDVILDSDGTFLEISSISEDPEDPDSLDIYVKRGDKDAYYPLKKDDEVTIFRGTGVLPTPENLKRAQDAAKGLKTAKPAEDILTGEDQIVDENDPRVTSMRKDPSQVQRPIRPEVVPAYKAVLGTYKITNPLMFYMLEDITENPENYEYWDAQNLVNSIKVKFEKRPSGEYTAQKGLRDLLKSTLQKRQVPEEQKKIILKNLHTYSRGEAEQLNSDLSELEKATVVQGEEGEDVAPSNLPDTSAQGIVRQRGEQDFRESDFTISWGGQDIVLSTSLVGPDAPNKATIAKAAQVITNYFVDADNPNTLKFFIESHRALPKKQWKNLIETWGKPEFSKYDRPDMFRDALSEAQGGPRNRQLASVARSISKGVLPDYFVDWVMQNYKNQPLAWFAKVIDVVKVLENAYDREVLNYAMRNRLDLEDLRVPDGYPPIPALYEPLEGAGGVTPEKIKFYQDRIVGSFPEYMRRMYSEDPFWKDFMSTLPVDGAPAPEENKEEELARVLKRAARLADGRRTRRRINKVIASLVDSLGLSNRELSMDGKRFVQQTISNLVYLRNSLDGRRKNIIQESPAEFDRRLKIITSALANKPIAYSYGRLRNPSEKTLNRLEDLASLVGTLVGSYRAGENADSDDIAVDRRKIFEAATPQMQRFIPPAFDGPVFEDLAGVSDYEELKDFISGLELHVLDFETTGIPDINDPKIKNDPIQLAVAIAKNFSINYAYNAYINPESAISGFTLQTIGDGTGSKVTKEFLQSKRSKAQAMKEFLDLVPNNAVLVGHNGLMFDMEVLNRTLREAGLPEYQFGGFIDTYGLSSYIMPRWSKENPDAPFKLSSGRDYGAQKPSDSLESLVTYFGLSNNGRHEADADVVSTLEVLEKMLDFAIAGRAAAGRSFDFYSSKNGWSKEEYEKAQEQYSRDAAAYIMSRAAFNISMAMENLNVNANQAEDGVSQEVLDKIQELARRPIPGIDDDRTPDLPASRIVKELASTSYVVDNNTGRVGRSYGATGNGLVLVEFTAADYLTSARKVLEKIAPSNLYNATESLIVKGGKVLDYGMTVSHPSLGKENGVFQGFENIKVGLVKSEGSLYRVPVKDLSVVKYAGNDPASSEQISKAQGLINELEKSKNISSSFASALRKTIDSDSYPSGSMSDLIAMLVNAREQRNVVDANKDAPNALPEAQSSASSATDDPIVDRRKVNKLVITEKDVEDVELDLSLIKQNMPNLQLTDEVVSILKAFAAVVDPKNKGKSLNKKHYNLVIRAYAGAGKTTTVEAITNLAAAMRPEEYLLYLVFGKENAEEADTRLMAGNTFASTLHALAYNVEANKDLKAKFQKQPELTGRNEGLNVQYAPERVAETFGIYEQFSPIIKERYGDHVDVPVQVLVQMAHDGLENWAMSADRDMAAKHFRLLMSYLAERPSWGPQGEKKFIPVDPSKLRKNEGVLSKTLKPVRFLRIDGKGKDAMWVFDFGDGAETKLPKSEVKEMKKFVESFEKEEDFYEHLVPELIEIAQLFWDDIISPLDTSRPQLLVDFQHMVKNWSLGNVDFTATKTTSSGKVVNALGLEKTPSVILLDEGQDMNPVFVDIMSRQASQYDNGVQIVTVGDSNQSIFAFSGNVDALQEVPADGAFPLSTSYRAAPELLDPINFMLGILRAPDKLKTAIKDVGYIVEDGTLLQKNMWIITRTNAGILDAAAEMETTDVFKNSPFAVTSNFKKRMIAHIKTLEYLYDISKKTGEVNKLQQELDDLLSQYGADSKIQAVEIKKAELQEAREALKTRKPPTGRPPVLIGATWEALQKRALEDKLDADTAIIWKLASREKTIDAEGNTKRASRITGIRNIRKRLESYRVINKHIELPAEIGKAGFLGSNMAYVVKNGKLVIGDGGGFPKGKKPGDFGMGVVQNSKILESIGFERTQDIDESTGLRKWEWERRLRNEDQNYIDGQVSEVYKALSGEDAELTIMTGHTSKGLENEAVRLWNDWDPTYLGTSQSDSDNSGEKQAKTKEQIEKEKNKIKEILNRQEFNLYYVVLSRAMRLLDMGGLGKLFKREEFISQMEDAIAQDLGEGGDDDTPIVDKRVFKGQGEYYDQRNKEKYEKAEAYYKSLANALATPMMSRVVPFKYATDNDIQLERERTRRLMEDIEMNPNADRLRDENNRFGLLEILAMIESGMGVASLSEQDRQRLFAYLGSSSLGSSGALVDDPTDKIKEAIAELNRRLGIG